MGILKFLKKFFPEDLFEKSFIKLSFILDKLLFSLSSFGILFIMIKVYKLYLLNKYFNYNYL